MEYEAGGGNISIELQSVQDLQSRVFLLYAELHEASTIFAQAEQLGLTGVGHVWIVTEQALSVPNCPIGKILTTILMTFVQERPRK